MRYGGIRLNINIMPKLDPIQTADRLRQRLEELVAGKEVAARDLKALLTNEQIAAIDEAWAVQQALRKQKRARTKDEQVALGWKSKREVQIEILQKAVAEFEAEELEAYEELLHQRELKAARVFMDAFCDTRVNNKNGWSEANAALQRAGFPRTDRVARTTLSQRDKEVRDMEAALMARFEAEMTPEEREQLELAREFDESQRRKR
jgi:hypothetical protein